MQVSSRGAWALALVVAAAAVVSCAGPEKKTVAKVGDRKVTVADVVLQYRTMSVNVRPNVETLETKRGFVNDIINKEILIGEATKRGLDKSPELDRAVRQFEDGKLAEMAYLRNVREKINVDEAKLRQVYEGMGEQAQLRVIFVPAEAKAREIEATLKGGADFAAVAREHSADVATAQRGGDLGMKPWADFPPEVVAAARPLQPGGVSGVFAMQGGFALVKLEARQANPMSDFESEKGNLLQRMRTAEEQRLATEWQNGMRAEINAQPDSAGIALLIARMRSAAQNRRSAQYGGPIMEISTEEGKVPLLHVGDRTWTVGDYMMKLREVDPARRPALSVSDAQLASFVIDLAVRERAIEDARKAGYADLPDVKSAVERFREKQMVTLLHREISKVDSIPDDDVARYYEDHQASLIAPASARILPATFPTKEAADAVRRRVRQQTTTLKRAAMDESLERLTETQAEEGVVIARSPDPTALEKAVFATDEKRVGGPVKTDRGWTIFRVIEKSGEMPLTLAQATPQIQARLRDEMSTQRFDDWLASERERLNIRIDDKVLAGIDFGTKERSDSTGTGGTQESGPTPVTAGG